ncbi:hypothetical protein [Streptomyces sp. AK02-01A]|uniref:hypothetical protein n=1 Tax=Streptomyces sp. AK02-01A TaxID=3028648 RepID=UPI0029A4FCCD|nr:hypothetical protein [Streptomyces sp. AK02-01A]MDX3851709.1 hypothetical protein [Streptomyces sp. AK02-01A]
MRFHYNSNYKGAYRNLGYSQYDIGAAVGSPALGVMALKYCSGTGAGAGTGVKNNAASVTNSHPTYLGVIYYNSGYKGVADVCAWSMNLVNTYNNNASFRWE